MATDMTRSTRIDLLTVVRPGSTMNHRWNKFGNLLAFGIFLSAVSGCAGMPAPDRVNHRAFNFNQDTFAYANELDWEYLTDPATGQTTTRQNLPQPEFAHGQAILPVRAIRPGKPEDG
jgi:hypothetical protein